MIANRRRGEGRGKGLITLGIDSVTTIYFYYDYDNQPNLFDLITLGLARRYNDYLFYYDYDYQPNL